MMHWLLAWVAAGSLAPRHCQSHVNIVSHNRCVGVGRYRKYLFWNSDMLGTHTDLPVNSSYMLYVLCFIIAIGMECAILI